MLRTSYSSSKLKELGLEEPMGHKMAFITGLVKVKNSQHGIIKCVANRQYFPY